MADEPTLPPKQAAQALMAVTRAQASMLARDGQEAAAVRDGRGGGGGRVSDRRNTVNGSACAP